MKSRVSLLRPWKTFREESKFMIVMERNATVDSS